MGHRSLVVVRRYASVPGIVGIVVVIYGVNMEGDVGARQFLVEVFGFVDDRRKSWVRVPALGQSLAIPDDPAGNQNPVLLTTRAMLVLIKVRRSRVAEPTRLRALSVDDLARDDSAGRLTSRWRLRITFLASEFLGVSLLRLSRGIVGGVGRRLALAEVMGGRDWM